MIEVTLSRTLTLTLILTARRPSLTLLPTLTPILSLSLCHRRCLDKNVSPHQPPLQEETARDPTHQEETARGRCHQRETITSHHVHHISTQNGRHLLARRGKDPNHLEKMQRDRFLRRRSRGSQNPKTEEASSCATTLTGQYHRENQPLATETRKFFLLEFLRSYPGPWVKRR